MSKRRFWFVTWQAVDGKFYNVLYRTDLLYGTWLTNATGVAGLVPETTNSVSVVSPQAFFKVELNQ